MLQQLKRLLKPNPQVGIYRQFFSAGTPSTALPAGAPRVLMYVGIGSMYLTPVEIALYHLLRARGIEVDYYVYGADVPINEVITKARFESPGRDPFWAKAYADASSKLKAAGVSYREIEIRGGVRNEVAALPDDLDVLLAYERDGIDFGDIAASVLYRFYKSLSFGPDAVARARDFLVTAISNYEQVKRANAERQYAYALFSHGIYCTWAPVVAYCEHAGLDYICYDRAKKRGHTNWNVNQPSPQWDIDVAWSEWAERELSPGEAGAVDAYLAERETQRNDVYAYNLAGRERDLAQVRAALGIGEGQFVVTVFTNLIWDAANVSRDIAFASPLECIEQTVAWAEQRGGVQVLVRSHPAEKVLGTNERYADLVRGLYADRTELPACLTLVDYDVNSFNVIDVSDVGVVHTSTVGLEMALEGKPCILISETHYRGKGFTLDVASPGDYFAHLEAQAAQPQGLDSAALARARRYFYVMMFRYQHAMPIVTDGNRFAGYEHDDFAALDADHDDALVRLADKIAQSARDKEAYPIDTFVV